MYCPLVAIGGCCIPYLSALCVTSVPWIITEFVNFGARVLYFLGPCFLSLVSIFSCIVCLGQVLFNFPCSEKNCSICKALFHGITVKWSINLFKPRPIVSWVCLSGFVPSVELRQEMARKVLLNSSYNKKCFRQKFYVHQLFPQNHSIYKIMWENMVELDRPLMTI